MSLGGIIRQRRKDLNLTQDEVAARAGISKPYLSNIETGRVKNPPSDEVLRELERTLQFKSRDLRHLAHVERTPTDVRHEHDAELAELEKLRVIVKQLTEGSKGKKNAELARRVKPAESISETFSAGRPVPVINRVAAGYPHHFTDLDYPTSIADEYVRVPDVHDPQAFAARVVGDSMEPRYFEGDLVVFAPNLQPNSGDACFVRFSGDSSTTFKRFVMGKDCIRLEALNEKYPSKEYAPDDINGLWPAVMRIERLR
jgi:SOS-response transcriptional repressor LexA